jgi:hypothetical protein
MDALVGFVETHALLHLFSARKRAPPPTDGAAHSSAPAIHPHTRRFFLTLACRECQLKTQRHGAMRTRILIYY